jgi:hypothetical protein
MRYCRAIRLGGGWLIWRNFAVGPRLSLGETIVVAILASLLSIIIACVVLTVMAMVVRVIETGELYGALDAAHGGFLMLIFVAVLFGPILLGLITAWSLIWRLSINR